MDDDFYKENLDSAILARDEIIARFQEWWSEDEILDILGNPIICSYAFLRNMKAMAELQYVKSLDHKQCAKMLVEQVGEKFLQDEDIEKRYEFFIKILRANSEKKEEINELLAETFLDITLEDIPEYSSDELQDYLRNKMYKHPKFLGKLIDIIGLPLACAEKIPKGRDWKSQLIEPLAPVGALYDFQRDISRQIQHMLTEYSDDSSRALVALPTGSGKTRVVVESVIDWINNGKPGQPKKQFIIWMVDRKELCQQAFDTFRTMFLSKGRRDTSLELLVYWGNKSKNIASQLKKAEEDDDTPEGLAVGKTTIIIASRGSLVSIVNKNEKLPEKDQYLKKLWEKLALVIIDEAHSAMSETSTQVLYSLGFNFRSAAAGGKPHPNDARLLGMTATPFKNIKLADSNTDDEASVKKLKRIDKSETEKLQSRFGNNFIWPDINSSISRKHVNPPHAIMELQKYATVGNDVLMSAKRSFDQDGRIVGYYWQVKKIEQGGSFTYKYDTGKKNGLTKEPKENIWLWRNSPSLKLDEDEEKWAGKDVFDEPGLYDIFLWVKDDDGLCNQQADVRKINITMPETKSEQDAQIRMRDILKNLKEQKVLASPRRWIINHDLSHLNLNFKRTTLKGRQIIQNELDDESMRKIAADTEFNRKIIHVLIKLIRDEKRKSILVFANTVEHAKLLSSMIRSAITEDGKPVTSEFVYANTNVDERCRFIKEFREQKLRVLCNYDILTQGFDAPKVDAIVVARDTGSYVLHTQMIGRGLRGPRNGGTPVCRIVDFSNKIREQDSSLSPEQRLDGWRFHKDLYDEDKTLSDFELGFKKPDDMKWPDSSYEAAYNVWKNGGDFMVREKKNLFTLFTEKPEYQEWQPEFWEYIKETYVKLQEELSEPPVADPAMTGLDLANYKFGSETALRTESLGKIVLPDNSEILFESNPKAIGRDDFSNDLQSKNENIRKISRVQFTISQESGHYYIEDGVTSVQEKPSTNGTKVNGQDITGQGKKELENDDIIELSGIIGVTFHSTKTDQKKTMSTDEIFEHTCPKCNKVNVKYHQPPTEEENELIEKSFGWRGNRIQSWCRMCRS